MNSELTKLIEEALGGGRGTTGLVLILLSWIAGIFGAFLGSYFNVQFAFFFLSNSLLSSRSHSVCQIPQGFVCFESGQKNLCLVVDILL
jgi:hypothetical protein